MLLRQRLSQLLTCIEDMSSDDEASDEVSRTLDEAFQLCGHFIPTDAFRLTRARAHTHIYTSLHRYTRRKCLSSLKFIWIMCEFLYRLTLLSGFQ